MQKDDLSLTPSLVPPRLSPLSPLPSPLSLSSLLSLLSLINFVCPGEHSIIILDGGETACGVGIESTVAKLVEVDSCLFNLYFFFLLFVI